MMFEVQNGTEMVGYCTTISQALFDRCNELTICDSGMNSSVSGTRYTRNTQVASVELPQKRIRVSPKAASTETAIDTAPIPPETFPRSLAAPSLLAHIIMLKYGQGMPLFRIEDGFALFALQLDAHGLETDGMDWIGHGPGALAWLARDAPHSRTEKV